LFSCLSTKHISDFGEKETDADDSRRPFIKEDEELAMVFCFDELGMALAYRRLRSEMEWPWSGFTPFTPDFGLHPKVITPPARPVSENHHEGG
jgi:hypothetical protein